MKLRVIIALSSAALLTLALALVSSAGPTCTGDGDSDGICDNVGDNCSAEANPGQRDDDEDGYGNICDSDVTQDCLIGGPDISSAFVRSPSFAPWSPKNDGAYDVDEDNIVGGPDISVIFVEQAAVNPGPSTKSCADCTALPTSGLGLGVCP